MRAAINNNITLEKNVVTWESLELEVQCENETDLDFACLSKSVVYSIEVSFLLKCETTLYLIYWVVPVFSLVKRRNLSPLLTLILYTRISFFVLIVYSFLFLI